MFVTLYRHHQNNSKPKQFKPMNRIRKLLVLVVLFMSLSSRLLAQSISYVETTRSWHYIYDEKGKKIHAVSTSEGSLAAYGSSFYVLCRDSFYRIYDPKGRKLGSLSRNVAGEVVGGAGNTFTSRKGGWLYTWSREGKKLSARWVQR